MWQKILVITLFLGFIPNLSLAKTVVTSYVFDTQKERKSTRWTLTEWLRIKERMRMMDLWLAMFSNPKKEKFAPELSLAYQQLTLEDTFSSIDEAGNEVSESNLTAIQYRGQFWFTNLISSTTGLKTPNIDLGIEYTLRQAPKNPLNTNLTALGQGYTLTGKSYNYTCLNFRIFGRNIQDSSVVLKYGQYSSDRGFNRISDELKNNAGIMAAAEMSFYFFSWLGLEGTYIKFGNSKGAAGSDDQSGSQLESSLFLEIYNLRLNYGQVDEEWRWDDEGINLENKTKSQFIGAKLQF